MNRCPGSVWYGADESDLPDLSDRGLQVDNLKRDPTLSESDNEQDLGFTHFRAAGDCEKRASKKKSKFHFDTSKESDTE